MSNGGFGGIHQKLLDKLAKKAEAADRPFSALVRPPREGGGYGWFMLISQRVTSTDSAYFPALDALYGRAFPWHEQREAEAKQQALDNPHYVLEDLVR